MTDIYLLPIDRARGVPGSDKRSVDTFQEGLGQRDLILHSRDGESIFCVLY